MHAGVKHLFSIFHFKKEIILDVFLLPCFIISPHFCTVDYIFSCVGSYSVFCNAVIIYSSEQYIYLQYSSKCCINILKHISLL